MAEQIVQRENHHRVEGVKETEKQQLAVARHTEKLCEAIQDYTRVRDKTKKDGRWTSRQLDELNLRTTPQLVRWVVQRLAEAKPKSSPRRRIAQPADSPRYTDTSGQHVGDVG